MSNHAKRPAASTGLRLNFQALWHADRLLMKADEFHVDRSEVACATIIDCGKAARGGIKTGLELARICMAGLGEVSVEPGRIGDRDWPLIQVFTDHPV